MKKELHTGYLIIGQSAEDEGTCTAVFDEGGDDVLVVAEVPMAAYRDSEAVRTTLRSLCEAVVAAYVASKSGEILGTFEPVKAH